MKSDGYILLAKAWLKNMTTIPESKVADIEERAAKDALLADLAADTISDIAWAYHYSKAGDKDCFNVYVKSVVENVNTYESVLSEMYEGKEAKQVKEVYVYYKDMRFFTSEDRVPHIAAEKSSLQQMIIAHYTQSEKSLMSFVSCEEHALLIKSGLLNE